MNHGSTNSKVGVTSAAIEDDIRTPLIDEKKNKEAMNEINGIDNDKSNSSSSIRIKEMKDNILLQNIWLRDPFIFTRSLSDDVDNRLLDNEMYILFGTSDKPPVHDIWGEHKATGFSCYASADMVHWRGPIDSFTPPLDFWADTQYWAPEVYRFSHTHRKRYETKYVMVATFKKKGYTGRSIHLLISDHVTGPYTPYNQLPITSMDEYCLDGTIYIDPINNDAWLVYCKEWLQVLDGEMWAVKLSKDLSKFNSDPVKLFSASMAPWTRPLKKKQTCNSCFSILCKCSCIVKPENYVTDGPFLHRVDKTGELVMLWSSIGERGNYMVGISRSSDGTLLGEWTHDTEPLFKEDGGHCCIFRSKQTNKLMISFHTPNKGVVYSRPVIYQFNEHVDEDLNTTFSISKI